MWKKNYLLSLCLITALLSASAQQQRPTLDVPYIMRDQWIGNSPSRFFWSPDSKTLYFSWNPEKADADSLYAISPTEPTPRKLSLAERKATTPPRRRFSEDYEQVVFEKSGDLYLREVGSGKERPLFLSQDRERLLRFEKGEQALYFSRENNAFRLDLRSGLIEQLTDFRKGKGEKEDKAATGNQAWLEQEEMGLIGVLKERKEKSEKRQEAQKKEDPPRLKPIYFGKKQLENLQISPDGRFVSYWLRKGAKSDRTKVPSYVVEDAYTRNLKARPKVGSPLDKYHSYLLDRQRDTLLPIIPDSLPGIRKAPDYLVEYGHDGRFRKPKATIIYGPFWSDDGQHAVVVVRSQDFKDRWIARLDLETGLLHNLDHQHDEAWIGGPGIVRWLGPGTVGWMPDDQRFWFLSEESGYAHLYWVEVESGKKKALTKGKFEIYDPRISRDEQSWYFASNAVHSGERHFYQMPLEGGKPQQLTRREGHHDVTLSPDEKYLAIRFSQANQPWELYLQKNEAGADAQRITRSQSEAFLAYPWRTPEFITFKASDGAKVPARLYRPENPEKQGPAVIFVHGAGYLQNAHKWWSNYYREYMFHNLLVDKGYTVLDIDFRASAGYGRDWRTAVYRDMGGKDLSDQVDGAKFLVDKYDIDPDRIGIYGGSYGGFISIMAMCKASDVFACGAALRPVTDWAHYNHPYTGSMLNLPQDDSLAYVRSSPIYHAEGLGGPLLICHGMIDTNVHFQDVVRLAQRFIELGKDDWEVAIYPLEGHGFQEASSWTDEYKRILKLFEEYL
jgi:dipeptidyl aminopeptidase/acylaminoacyl peptidase